VQEAADLTYLAFDLADKYRMPVIIHADGMIGQMMEACVLPPEKEAPKRGWTVGHEASQGGGTSRSGKEAVHITSIDLVPESLEAKNKERFKRYEIIKKAEIRFEETNCEGASLVMVAYGTCARVCLGAQKMAQKEGIKLGIFRPISLWPFPYDELGKAAADGKPLLTVEMSEGQLVEDVKLSAYYAESKSKVHLLGRSGGMIPTEEEVFAKVKEILK